MRKFKNGNITFTIEELSTIIDALNVAERYYKACGCVNLSSSKSELLAEILDIDCFDYNMHIAYLAEKLENDDLGTNDYCELIKEKANKNYIKHMENKRNKEYFGVTDIEEQTEEEITEQEEEQIEEPEEEEIEEEEIEDVEKIIARLNEIEEEMEKNRQYAEESCVDEGYPTHGSNYELRVESFNKELIEEINLILEEYDELVVFNDGVWKRAEQTQEEIKEEEEEIEEENLIYQIESAMFAIRHGHLIHSYFCGEKCGQYLAYAFIRVSFNDNNTNNYIVRHNKSKLNKVSTCTWVRIWINEVLVLSEYAPKYVARDLAIKFLKQKLLELKIKENNPLLADVIDAYRETGIVYGLRWASADDKEEKYDVIKFKDLVVAYKWFSEFEEIELRSLCTFQQILEYLE